MTQTDVLLGIVMIPVIIDYLDLVFGFLPDGSEPKKLDGGPLVISLPLPEFDLFDAVPFDDIGNTPAKKEAPAKVPSPVKKGPPAKFSGKCLYEKNGCGEYEWS